MLRQGMSWSFYIPKGTLLMIIVEGVWWIEKYMEPEAQPGRSLSATR